MLALVTGTDKRVTRVQPAASAAQLVVQADPRRLFLMVLPNSGTTIPVLCTDTDVLAAWSSASMPAPLTMKFHDAPQLTTAAWYRRGTDAVGGWIVLEELYQGG